MGNCLITKLKGSVNANLPLFGGYRFKVKSGANDPAINVQPGMSMKIQGNGVFLNYNKTQELGKEVVGGDAGVVAYISGWDSNTIVLYKHDYKNFSYWNENCGPFAAQLECLDSPYMVPEWVDPVDVQAYVEYMSGKDIFAPLENCTNVQTIVAQNFGAIDHSGNLSSISHLKKLTSINLNNMYRIVSSISPLGELPLLTTANIANVPLYGAIEDIVYGQRRNGRTTGSIGFTWLGSNNAASSVTGITVDPCTFDGKTILSTASEDTEDTLVGVQASTLSWTANTITLSRTGYSDITINA